MFVLAISGFARMEVQRVLKRNITKFIGAVLHFFDLKEKMLTIAVWYYMYYNFKKLNTQTAKWRTVCFPFKIIYTPICV